MCTFNVTTLDVRPTYKIDPLARSFEPLFHCRDMVRLNLGRNRLDKVPSEALSNLRYLEILDLTENEISKIEAGDFRGELR